MSAQEMLKAARQAQIEANPTVTVTVFNKRDQQSFKVTFGNVRRRDDEVATGFVADVLALDGDPYIDDELFVALNDGYYRAAIFQRNVTGPIGTFPAQFVETLFKSQAADREHREVERENAQSARKAGSGNFDTAEAQTSNAGMDEPPF